MNDVEVWAREREGRGEAREGEEGSETADIEGSRSESCSRPRAVPR